MITVESDALPGRNNGGRFMRIFKLPSFVDSQQASATQKNGTLTVTFAKREEAKSRRILIEGE